MEKVNAKENRLAFRAEIDESLANAIRRYTFEIPVLAIDDVEISKNDSALYDETIAHRLGLTPLIMPKTVAKTKEYAVELSSKKEGFVYSGEMEGDIKIAYDKIPLTMLDKGQELEFKAIARLGKGKEHSKFTPGLMVYRNVVEIKTDKNCPVEVIEECPHNLFVDEGGRVKVDDNVACDSCGICMEFTKKAGKECVTIEPTKELLVTIESFGQLPPEEIFIKAIERLKEDLDEVAKKI